MSCNGNNHSNCNCGFGGGHGNASSLEIRFREWAGSSYEKYLNIDAKCPVCRTYVVFYQSPHGGRVFFDFPVGYPWKKHRCTDHRSNRSVENRSKIISSPLEAGNWFLFEEEVQASEWTTDPIVVREIPKNNPYLLANQVRFASRKQMLNAVDVTGKLVIVQPKSSHSIKILKSDGTSLSRQEKETFSYNDSFRLTIRLESRGKKTVKKIELIRNSFVRATLSADHRLCTLTCIIEGKSDIDITAQVVAFSKD